MTWPVIDFENRQLIFDILTFVCWFSTTCKFFCWVIWVTHSRSQDIKQTKRFDNLIVWNYLIEKSHFQTRFWVKKWLFLCLFMGGVVNSYIFILPHSHTVVNGDDSDDRICNFPYRKSFTPDLNVFPYIKVSISIVTIVTTLTSNSRYLLSRARIPNVPSWLVGLIMWIVNQLTISNTSANQWVCLLRCQSWKDYYFLMGGGGGGVVTLDGLCCCGLGSLFGITNYFWGLGGGGVVTLAGVSRWCVWLLLLGILLSWFRGWRGVNCWGHLSLNLLNIIASTNIYSVWRITSMIVAHHFYKGMF